MAGEISFHEMFQVPTIRKVMSTIATPDSYFQHYFKMAPGNAPVETISGRYYGWDIANDTRTIAKGRAPGSGPSTTQAQPLGTKMAILYRSHESIPILQEKIFRTRPPGADFGMVDIEGQRYISRQMKRLTQRFKNLREFMISRLFRGGWGVKVVGEDWIPVELNDASAVYQVLPGVATGHTGRLLLDGSTAVIDTLWDDPSADLLSQFLNLRKYSSRKSGYVVTDVFLNSTTFGHLMRNINLATQAGTSNVIFQEWKSTDDGSPAAHSARANVSVVKFRALPWITFHVYDGTLRVGSDTDSTAAADQSLLIPDGKAIICPQPGEWIGLVEGSEIVAKDVMDQGSEVKGFEMWKTRCIDPAGWHLKGIDNALPIAFNPDAYFYADVTSDA